MILEYSLFCVFFVISASEQGNGLTNAWPQLCPFKNDIVEDNVIFTKTITNVCQIMDELHEQLIFENIYMYINTNIKTMIVSYENFLL